MPPPPEHASHWTLRALATKVGTTVSTVFGILKSHGLKPHRINTFKVSRDPRFLSSRFSAHPSEKDRCS